MPRQPIVLRRPTIRGLTAGALALLLLMQTTGCAVWHPVADPIPTLQAAKPPDGYQITRVGGKVIELTKLRVRGDSLLGMADSTAFVRGSLEAVPYPVGIPVAQVLRVERNSVSALRYLTFVLGSLALAVFIGFQTSTSFPM